MRKLNTGYIRTVLESRGMRPGNADRMRDLVAGLEESDYERLAESLRKFERGVDEGSDFELVSALANASSDEVVKRLEKCGLRSAEPSRVFAWLASNEAGMRTLIEAAGGDDAQRERIREWIGIDDRAEEGRETLTQEIEGEEPRSLSGGETSASARKQGRKARKVTAREGQDKAQSYAREDGAVKTASAAKHHVYVTKAGLTFELDILRRPEEGRKYTVRIEGAEGRQGKAFDWANKVIVQLTASELHQAAAVFLGMSERMVARHHGDLRDKSLEINRQEQGVLVRLTATGRVMAVPVDASHLYKVALVFVRALYLNDPDIEHRVLLDTLRLTAAVCRPR